MIDQERIARLRVLWTKGRNFYQSFLTELGHVHTEIGNDAKFVDWCLYDLQIGMDVITDITGVLRKTDAKLARAEFARATAIGKAKKMQERDATNAARDAENKLKLEAKHARGAEQARLAAEKKAAQKNEEQKKRRARNLVAVRAYGQRKKEAYVANTNKINELGRFTIAGKPVELPELATRIKRAYGQTLEWIDSSIELAALLCEARSRFSNDNAFGKWLDENKIPLKHQDRAALLNLGANVEAMRRALESTDRKSYRLIWQDVLQQISVETKE